MSSAPSLVGVSHATGATSRYIAFSCAGVLVIAALFPFYAAFFLLLPQPVVGAAVTFTASFMIASGIQIILSRNLDSRTTFVVGIATPVALVREFFSELLCLDSGPPSLRHRKHAVRGRGHRPAAQFRV
jgi:xanthine permease XanP